MASPQRTGTILVVDDEEPILRAAERVLERHGYTVLLAASGEEGLRMFKAQKAVIGLVISDTLMPGMSGPELYEAIQAEATATKFILMSGSGWELDRQNPVPYHGLPFLHKPWQIANFVTLVREVLDGP